MADDPDAPQASSERWMLDLRAAEGAAAAGSLGAFLGASSTPRLGEKLTLGGERG